jgi:hypothetical protein
MLSDVPLIPAPLPSHLSLASRYVDWMRKRAGQGLLRGMFFFKMLEDGGTVEFHPAPQIDVLALMALGIPEEVATSIWHLVRTYDSEAEVMALVVDRTTNAYSLVRIKGIAED